MMSLNEMEMNLKLARIEVCDLLLACTNAMATCRECNDMGSSRKWLALHDKLMMQLDEFDKKQGY